MPSHQLPVRQTEIQVLLFRTYSYLPMDVLQALISFVDNRQCLNVIYHIFVYFSTYYLYFISLFVFYAQHLSFQNLLHTKKIVTGISLQHMTIKKKCLCHYTNISLFHPSFIFPESCSPRSLYDFFMKSESPVKTSRLLPSFPALLKVCGS